MALIQNPQGKTVIPSALYAAKEAKAWSHISILDSIKDLDSHTWILKKQMAPKATPTNILEIKWYGIFQYECLLKIKDSSVFDPILDERILFLFGEEELTLFSNPIKVEAINESELLKESYSRLLNYKNKLEQHSLLAMKKKYMLKHIEKIQSFSLR